MPQDTHQLVIPYGTEVIRRDQFRGKQYSYVFIPQSVVTIQKGAFYNCTDLRTVVFEEKSKLQTIGEEAF